MFLPTRWLWLVLVGGPLFCFSVSTYLTIFSLKRGGGMSPYLHLTFAGLGVLFVGIVGLIFSGEKVNLPFPNCIYSSLSGAFWSGGILTFGFAIIAGIPGWLLTVIGNGTTYTVLFFELAVFGVNFPVSARRIFVSLFLYALSNVLIWPKFTWPR